MAAHFGCPKGSPGWAPENQRIQMKKTLISFVILLFAVLSSAQNDFDKTLLNPRQLSPNWIEGKRVEVRLPDDYSQNLSEAQLRAIKMKIEQAFVQAGAIPVWPADQILREADDLDSLAGSNWVDKKTLPKGGMKVSELIATFTTEQIDSYDQLAVWGGTLGSQFGLELDTSASQFGISFEITGRSGNPPQTAVFTAIGTARSTDNGTAVLSQILGKSAGISVSGESYDERNWRARNKGVEAVLKKFISSLKEGKRQK